MQTTYKKWTGPSNGMLLFWGGALAVSLVLFLLTRWGVACWRVTALPGIPPAYCSGERPDLPEAPYPAPVTGTPGTEAAEVIPVLPEATPPSWDGASRITIAFFGLRGGENSGEGCPNCTDTILLLSVDPLTRTAGMLSVPRDLWVNIPGFGYSRINTAWTLGEAARLPGGGPGLAMKTITQLIGLPIHYYVQVDFDTFVSVIDQIGGIDIYSDEKLKLDPLGSGKDHFVLTCCGLRHLDGRRALAYARCREESQGCSGGDFGRARRQQKVVWAVRDKVLNPANFPQLLLQAPQLYQAFSAGIHTNLSLEETVELAILAQEIPAGNIRQGVIDEGMVSFAMVSLNGIPSSVLRPHPDTIRILRDELFLPGGPLHPQAQGGLLTLAQADGARLQVINATDLPGLGQRTAEYLSSQGLQVVGVDSSGEGLERSKLILYAPKLYAWRYLIELFGVTGDRLVLQTDGKAGVDIEIRIGLDWADRLP